MMADFAAVADWAAVAWVRVAAAAAAAGWTAAAWKVAALLVAAVLAAAGEVAEGEAMAEAEDLVAAVVLVMVVVGVVAEDEARVAGLEVRCPSDYFLLRRSATSLRVAASTGKKIH